MLSAVLIFIELIGERKDDFMVNIHSLIVSDAERLL